MGNRIIGAAELDAFAAALRAEERSPGTVDKYMRDAARFAAWLDGREASRETAGKWREELLGVLSPVTVNSMLAAVNKLFRVLGWEDCRVRPLKLQRRLFREEGRELTRVEYVRLISAARAAGRERLSLLMESICASGIRVSEVRFITVEAAREGRARVYMKGKIREILLPGRLCRRLLGYARRKRIASGEIFVTRSGKGMSRKQIWAEMKTVCAAARVAAGKVFPHNLRHLFARVFYKATHDIAKLADVLGHSSIETTRIYLISTGEEHGRILDALGLVT